MPLWLPPDPLVLASKSEIRRSVLMNAGLAVEVQPADVDERGLEAQSESRDPSDVAILLACAKAMVVSERMPGRIVLGADQVLALGARRYSKPVDRDATRRQLSDLRGRTHALHGGLAVVRDGAVLYQGVDVARLTMRDFSDAFLETYLDLAGPGVMASVGGYQLERLGIHLFEKVEGDHFTVLGLPLFPLLTYLRGAGLVEA